MAAPSDFPPAMIAALLGVTERRLQQLASREDGGPWIPKGEKPGTYPLVGAVQGYIKFLREHGRATGRGVDHSRLARAQSVKVEMENMRRAGQLMQTELVLELMTSITTQLNSALEGLSGGLANELANVNDPAAIRQRLQDEFRGIRRQLSDRVQEFAVGCESRADDLTDVPAADAQDAGRVGEGQPYPAAELSEARTL